MAKQTELRPSQLNRIFCCLRRQTDRQTALPPLPNPPHPCLETAVIMTPSSQALLRALASSAAALSALLTLQESDTKESRLAQAG